MITINREKWADCFDELLPMFQQVFELVEAEITGLPLDFDHDTYNELDSNDLLHCLVMRAGGIAIGFHLVVISAMPRHKGHNQAHTDAIFVLPEHRRHSTKLLHFSQEYIAQKASFWTLANLDPNDRALMWYKKGFVPIETIMFKNLYLKNQGR